MKDTFKNKELFSFGIIIGVKNTILKSVTNIKTFLFQLLKQTSGKKLEFL